MVGHAGPVYGVAFDPAGALLASAGADKTVRFWNPTTGEPHGAPFTGHTAAVLGVAFSPDGGLVASGGADHSVRLWNSTFADWVVMGCRLVNRNLSSSEWDEIAPDLRYERTCPDLPSGEGAPANAPAARYSPG
jgi:WD40 repeat protein